MAYGVVRRADKLRRSIVSVTLAIMLTLPAAAEVRLAALGDSLTQGYGLNEGEGLVPQLEAFLREAGQAVTVLNAGVSGDTTAGGLSRLDWTLGDNPDAMLVILGGNDLLRGIDPAASRANLDAILTRLGAEGVPAMLVGLPAPGNFGPEFRDAFRAMYTDLAEAHGVPLYPDLLAPLTEAQAQGGGRVDWLLQDDRIHPNAEGVAEIVAGLGPVVAEWLAGLETEQGS